MVLPAELQDRLVNWLESPAFWIAVGAAAYLYFGITLMLIAWKTNTPHAWLAWFPLLNLFGNFYAAPAQYMIGGEVWAKWYAQIKSLLLKNVTSLRGEQFYWEPKLDGGMGGVGPTYATSVYVMILAMPYHYIPLYQR